MVNYLPNDAQGVAPTIGLSTNFAPGIAEEGQRIRLMASVTDDVQVRNVEFFVDGTSVLRDGNFPFEHRFVTPLIALQPTFTIRACATDTGGNRTCSAESTLTLVPDATPPGISAVTPRAASSVAEGSTSVVSATFNEPVDEATLDSSTFRLFSAGPDAVTSTADDVLVPGTFSYRVETGTALLTFDEPLPEDSYRAVIDTSVTDLTGNSLPGEFAWTFRVAGPFRWINGAGGSFRDPANWSNGLVPGASDIVRITLPGSYTVLVQGSLTVSSLSIGTDGGGPTLWINGSNTGRSTTLTVTGDLVNHGTIRLESTNSNYTSNLTVADGVLTNLGRIVVNEGSRGSRVLTADVLNVGSLELSTGLTLAKAGGIFTNEGTVLIAAGQKLLVNGNSQVFRHNSGDLAGAGFVESGNATFELNGGSLTGAAPFLVNSTLQVSSAATEPAAFTLTGGISRLRGTTAVGQTVWVQGNNAGRSTSVDATGFTNGGLLRLQSRDSNYASNLTGGFTNAATGVVEVNAGSGGSRLIAGGMVNLGTLDVNESLTVTGVLTNTGSVDVTAGKSLALSGVGQVFRQDGGTISGAGRLRLSSGAVLNFDAGTVTGAAPVVFNSTLDVGTGSTGAASFILTGPSARLAGDVAAGQTVWVNGSNVGRSTTVTAAQGFTNAGTIRLQSSDSNYVSNLVVSDGVLVNTGVIEVNQGSRGSRTITADVDNQGSILVDSSLAFAGDLTHSGNLDLSSTRTMTMNGARSFTLAGGTIIGPGLLRLASGALLIFESGTTNATAPLLVASTLRFGDTPTGSASFTLSGSGRLEGSVGEQQTVWISGRNDGRSTTVSAAQGFTNAGTIRLESRNSNYASNLTVTGGVLVNTGVIEVLLGSRGARTLTAELDNLGTVEVASGTALRVVGTSLINSHGGVIRGEGRLDVASTTFSNAGEIRPGSSPGLLPLTGNLTQSPSGSLVSELGGTTVGSQYDRLDVSGLATLDGELDVVLIDGFVPALGQGFEVLRYGSRAGTFTAINGLDLGNGIRLEPTYGANTLILRVVAE